MASLHNRLFIPNPVNFFNNLLELLHQSSAEFLNGDTAESRCRRLEEYQRTLRVMYSRLEEYRRNTSVQLIEDIAQLIDIIGRRIERLETFYNDENVLEDQSSEQLYALGVENRIGNVGRPRVEITQEQIDALRNGLCFRWTDVARMFDISTRTLNRRRQKLGMSLGQEHNFSSLTDELDVTVREIFSVTPQSGLGLVQGALRATGLKAALSQSQFKTS